MRIRVWQKKEGKQQAVLGVSASRRCPRLGGLADLAVMEISIPGASRSTKYTSIRLCSGGLLAFQLLVASGLCTPVGYDMLVFCLPARAPFLHSCRDWLRLGGRDGGGGGRSRDALHRHTAAWSSARSWSPTARQRHQSRRGASAHIQLPVASAARFSASSIGNCISDQCPATSPLHTDFRTSGGSIDDQDARPDMLLCEQSAGTVMCQETKPTGPTQRHDGR